MLSYDKIPKVQIHGVNTICLIAMQYIYSVRCLKSLPNFACLKGKISDMMCIEKYINCGQKITKWPNIVRDGTVS